MNRKPVTAEEAIAIVEKRRQRARESYARLRQDALQQRAARKHASTSASASRRSPRQSQE